MITSSNMNISGWKMPRRAISIILLENTAPRMIPTEATAIMNLKEAALDPTADPRKLTASLLTPTMRSSTANVPINTIRKRKMSFITHRFGSRC